MESSNDKEFLLNSAMSIFGVPRVPPELSIRPQHELNPAEWAYKRIKSLINDFEHSLSPEEEIGCRLVSFGNSSVYYIDDVSYWGPDIIIFHCTDFSNGAQADLIQNISQLNVLLTKLPRKTGESQARRIGFSIQND